MVYNTTYTYGLLLYFQAKSILIEYTPAEEDSPAGEVCNGNYSMEFGVIKYVAAAQKVDSTN